MSPNGLTGLATAVTGHRPQHLTSADRSWFRSELRRVIAKLQPREFLSGMALGVDQDAAEIALELGLPLVAMVPFPAQDSRWQAADRAHYRSLLARAARVVLVSDVDPSTRWEAAAMLDQRNKEMVRRSAVVLACWTGKTSGGTWNALQDTKRMGLVLVTIRPSQVTTIHRPLGRLDFDN